MLISDKNVQQAARMTGFDLVAAVDVSKRMKGVAHQENHLARTLIYVIADFSQHTAPA